MTSTSHILLAKVSPVLGFVWGSTKCNAVIKCSVVTK